MNWQQVKDRPLGYPWQTAELCHCFEAVRGGVAFPGKNPGFAVVAGLRRLRGDNIHEVCLLDEVESDDMGALLRQCAGLGYKYQMDLARQCFEWIGDAKNTAASEICCEIADESQRRGPGEPVIVSSPITDMGPGAYGYMVSAIKQYATAEHKELFLNESKAELYLQQVKPSDIVDLHFGAFPAIEAVAFVLMDLREHAQTVLRDLVTPKKRSARVDLLGRERFSVKSMFR